MLSDHVNSSLWSMWLVVLSVCLCAENGHMYSFCGGDIFMIQMIFYVDMLNTKVIDNFLVLLVLKFHDFSPAGVGVIDFTSLLSAFVCPLNISEWLYCLTYLSMELCLGDNRRVELLFIVFPNC